MKKLTKIFAGVTALILSFGIVGCSKSTDYPKFRPSSNGGQITETDEKYTVNVRSAGGLKLNDVKVSAYNSSGVKVRTGISADGVINFNLSLGAYNLVVEKDSLPAGYYLEEDVTYTTNPEKREDVNISIPSAVISESAIAGKVYSLGEITNDFTLQDYRSNDENYSGTRNYKLSDILEKKKAVVLNFWYPTCTFCIQEFPALQSAYSSAKKNLDIEVLGVCFPGYSNKNVADFVKTYENDFKLTFPLCVDTAGLRQKFSAQNAPTTVVIDRYGMFAMREEGGQPSVSFWQELFKKYASDDYLQDDTATENPGVTPPGGSSADREKPNVEMPSSAAMAEAASGVGLNATYRADEMDEYAWPWTTGKDEFGSPVITVTNSGKQNSYSTLYIDVELKKDDLLSFVYSVSSEKDADKLYVLLDGQLLNSEGWSGDVDWTTYNAYVADRDKTVELTFIFTKDAGDPSAEAVGEDCAKIRNIRTSKISAYDDAIDIIRDAASGEFKSGKYEHYVDAVLGGDGFYHVGSATGPLLYISLTNITPWSKQHTDNNEIKVNGTSVFASLYDMSYHKYEETIESESGTILSFTVKIGDTDFATPLQQYHHMLDMLEKPYQLMPVSAQLQQWAEAFVGEYEKELGGKAHEDEWLEFCFYYDHYGKPHALDTACHKDTDTTKGLTIYNPFDVGFTSTPNPGDKTEMVNAEVKYPLAQRNGLYYKFTAPKNGVYQIRDYTGHQPNLIAYSLAENKLDQNYIAFSDGVRDFDQVTGVKYSSFNEYLVLNEGQTVYLELYIAEQTTGKFTFDITYFERVDKLMDCSTWAGAWEFDEEGSIYYIGINEVYDNLKDRYYHAGANGEPDRTKPIYINMLYESYFMSDLMLDDNVSANYLSIEELFKLDLFADISATDNAYIFECIEKAKSNVGDMHGLVEADGKLVSIINKFISRHTDAGDNRGWMAFACYMEHITHPAV